MRTKEEIELIERAMSARLAHNRASAQSRPSHKVGKSDRIRRAYAPKNGDRIHNEIVGMFGQLADTEVVII